MGIFKAVNDSNPLLFVCAVGIITFVLFPFAVNILIVTKIKEFVSSNNVAIAYFESNSAVFVSLCIVSGSAYSSLQLVSSRLFNLNIFNCGLTKYEMRQLFNLKVFGNVLIENVPQIALQILYIISSANNPSNVALLSTAASVLSVIGVLISWIVERQNSNCFVMQYDIEVNKKDLTQFTDDEKSKISQKKERKDELRKTLCQALRIREGQIELGHVTMFDESLEYHIVHYVMGNEVQLNSGQISENKDETFFGLQFVKALYTKHESAVNEAFMRHFRIDNDLNIVFVDAFKSPTSTKPQSQRLKTPSFSAASMTQNIELQIQGNLGEDNEKKKNASTAL